MNTRILNTVPSLLLTSLLLVGCNRTDTDENSTNDNKTRAPYTLCNENISHLDFYTLLDGNMVILSEQDQKGASAAQLATEMVAMLIVNGIDFSALSYEISCTNGRYTVSNGETAIGFALYYEEDGDGFSKGDIIPHNVFSPTSYIKNPNIDAATLLKGELKYTYDEGPLFELVNGSIDFNADLDDISFSLKLRGGAVSFEVQSEQNYSGLPPRSEDKLRLKMTTTRASLSTIHSQVMSGGFGYKLNGSRYESSHYGLVQNFSETSHLIRKSGDTYIWSGSYKADITKSGIQFYQNGYCATDGKNYTEYYCGEELTSYIGTANTHSSLEGGVFEFADGVTLPYGIQEF